MVGCYNATAVLYHFEAAENLNKLKLDFIRTDLDVALTFAQIAGQTGEREKSIRNQLTARKGYDAVLHYVGTASLTRFDQENLTRKLALLKSALLSLGESF
jgi:hypothetical protein